MYAPCACCTRERSLPREPVLMHFASGLLQRACIPRSARIACCTFFIQVVQGWRSARQLLSKLLTASLKCGCTSLEVLAAGKAILLAKLDLTTHLMGGSEATQGPTVRKQRVWEVRGQMSLSQEQSWRQSGDPRLQTASGFSLFACQSNTSFEA